MSTIKPVDTVRTPAEMKPADLEGIDGKWLDVPRLQQLSSENRSNWWCGRTSAAMVWNYYCKAQKKTAEYIGHEEGEQGIGLNGQKFNLRWLGGSHKGELAGITKKGYCDPPTLFTTVGLKTDSGELATGPQENIDTNDPKEVEKRFERHVEQIKKNNPVIQFTQLTEGKGHIVVVNGYKRDGNRGELWLRIVDPCYPHDNLLGPGNFKMITRPEKPDKLFAEYWVKARRLLEMYPKRTTRLYAHAEFPRGYFFYALPTERVKDDSELVHKVGKGLGETAGAKPAADTGKEDAREPGKDKPKPEKPKTDKPKAPDKAGAPASSPPVTGISRLPVMINGSNMVTAEAVVSLYHQTERGLGGFFPLGDNGLFHCGAHITPAVGAAVMAMADGEVVAARIGAGPGEHPWGDTGFVLLRHKVKGDKNVYCLYLHLRREVLHPDKTDAGWLKRLLIGAMKAKGEKKSRWRVMEDQATWKDADKGSFSPVNVHVDDKLAAGVYEEEDEHVQDAKRYVKLKGKWVRATGPDGDGGKVRELSLWSDYDLEEACKNSPAVKDLRDGKVAVLDADKEEGKRKWTLQAGDTVGRAGSYLGSSTLHWSVFSKDSVFPGGSLGEKEFGADEQPKVVDLDLSSKEHGTKEHAKALIEAVDPKKKYIGAKQEETVIEPGELRHFYRSPTESWRARYQAVKGLADFKLDLEKLVKQDRYKSHTDKERGDFTKNGKPFLFWDELSKAEDFPTDGKAVFVHPVTALRLMSQVRIGQDVDDPPEAEGANAEDRVHADEDVVLVVRDAKGPLAAVDVTVKADGEVILKGKTDSQGEIIVKLEDARNKDIEVSVDSKVVGDKGRFIQVSNETGSQGTLQPGDAPGNQSFNGQEVVPNPRMALRMKVKKGALVKQYGKWNAEKFQPEDPGAPLAPDSTITAERIVFRKEDGKWECIQILKNNREVYAWSIENGEEKIAADPAPEHLPPKEKDPFIVASWSSRIAHLHDHPVLAGRVQSIADGTELEVTFCAIMAVGAPEHDLELLQSKCKVAGGGFSAAFDPHQLTTDGGLLNAPRPVFARVKAKDKTFSLRDQPITVYGEAKFPDPAPRQEKPSGGVRGAKELVAYYQIDRAGTPDRLTTWSKEAAPERSLTQFSGAMAQRIVGDGWDKIYVGTAAPEQHLAVEGEEHMPPGKALAHHTARLRAAFPDAPDWVIAGDGTQAWKLDNGIQTGICAIHCKTAVNAQGKKAGCTETIRQSNLGACHTAAYEPCKTAIQIGHPNVVKKCGDVIGACGTAHHEKAHCFLSEPVLGPNAEERERWHVKVPMQLKNASGYPYYKRKDRALNLKLLLVNPRNGKAVVCSMEDRGPTTALSSGHDESAEVAVKQDEFIGKERLIGPSHEATWKLGLTRRNDPIVLVAFVEANTPLGPVADDVVIKLKKSVSFDLIMGEAAHVQPGVPGDKVKSGNIFVGGKHFADWFNDDFRPQFPGNHPELQLWKRPAPMFPGKMNKKNFQTVFDNVSHLWAPEITVQEFLGFLGIFYNETGGSLSPISEVGSPKYMFESSAAGKASYNSGGNRPAGKLLAERGVLTDAAQIEAWNGTKVYPDDSAIKSQALECDFWKFRGRGLIQLTFRSNYKAHCEPAMLKAGYKSVDEHSEKELEHIIKTDPRVYLEMVRSFFAANWMKEAFTKVKENSFYLTGRRVSGGEAYGKLYEWRCLTILDAMQKAGFEFR